MGMVSPRDAVCIGGVQCTQAHAPLGLTWVKGEKLVSVDLEKSKRRVRWTRPWPRASNYLLKSLHLNTAESLSLLYDPLCWPCPTTNYTYHSTDPSFHRIGGTQIRVSTCDIVNFTIVVLFNSRSSAQVVEISSRES
jgi:hypothetical protein